MLFRSCVNPSHLFNRGLKAPLIAALDIRPSVKKRHQEELAALREEVDFNGHYTLLDSLLNNKPSLELFIAAYKLLDTWMTSDARADELLATVFDTQPVD